MTGILEAYPWPVKPCRYCGEPNKPWWSHEPITCRACLPHDRVPICRWEQHDAAWHGGRSYSHVAVRAWLDDEPASPLRDALLAALTRFEYGRLPDWGPEVGSYAEGEYHRAHSIFYGIEGALHAAMAADGMEA